MSSKEKFIPPYPCPYENKIGRIKRFFIGLSSWIHTLYEKSYAMKMGVVKFPLLKMFIINEPKLAGEILMDKKGDYPKHFVQHKMLCPLLGESIFSTNGEKWKAQRMMINPSFTHTNLREVFGMMREASHVLIDNLTKKIGQDIHIDPIMNHVTADIIFRTILSETLTQTQANNIHKAFGKYQNYAQYIATLTLYKIPTFIIKKLAGQSAKHIHHIFEDIVTKRHKEFHARRKSGHDLPNNDILDSLMQATHPETKAYFSIKDIIDQLSIIFLAGHETSASALTWSLYLLGQCPHLQEKAFEEILNNPVIDFNNIKDFPVTHSIFQEALRLYPPVSFLPREAANDTSLRNREIHQGDMLSISPWLIHRNPNYWQDPHHFDPERFIQPDDTDKQGIKSCYMPFGKGKRVCVGAGFAKQEAVIILYDIIKNFSISILESHKVEPISKMTTRPKNGVYLRLNKR